VNILVTGGAGFIGSHLCEKLLGRGDTVVCLDNFNTYYDPAVKRDNISGAMKHKSFICVEGDIRDKDLVRTVFSKNSIDTVVHLAARAGVRPSIEDPHLYQQVNVEGTVVMLDAAREYGVSRFIMASSSSVYGNNKKVPFAETDNVDFPISPYAATKKACELLAYTYYSLYDMPVTCLRFFTVYGPRQRPDMAIHKFVRLISSGSQVPLFGDGSTKRDYTFITDIIDGIVRSIENCRGYEIYNLGESRTVELRYLISVIEKCLGKTADIQYLPMQPGDVTITYADVHKAGKELGYKPSVAIEDGIRMFTEWYITQIT